jgi:hypothetical protein
MKKIFVLTLMALLLAIVGVQPLYAQDTAYSAVPQSIPGLTNNGVTGASAITGYLNTTLNDGAGVLANGLGTFNAVDVAVGDFNADGLLDIIAATNDSGIGQITLFVGLGDGTFGLPLPLLTFDLPFSLAAADIDLDGITDLAVGEASSVETFSGFFFLTGVLTGFDVILPNSSGTPVSAVAFARINDDPLQDIVAANQGTASVDVFGTDPLAFTYSLGIATTVPTSGLIGTTILGLFAVPAPRAISSGIANVVDTVSGTVDADIDIFVATTAGIEILENQTPSGGVIPVFAGAPVVLAAGTGPVGAIAVDVNNDNVIDVISLNRGSGTVTVNLGNAGTAGYGSPPRQL